MSDTFCIVLDQKNLMCPQISCNPQMYKGPSINVNIFTSVQTIQFWGEWGSVKIKKNSVHF